MKNQKFLQNINIENMANGYILIGDEIEECINLANMMVEKAECKDYYTLEQPKMPDVRETIKEMNIKPLSSVKKIAIIYGDDLSVQCQNCLLKTLEEPRGFAVFILMFTNQSNILTTVRSRCITYRCESYTFDEILQKLNEKQVINAKLYALWGNGSLNKANAISDDPSFLETRNFIIDFLKGFRVGQLKIITKEQKEQVPQFFDMISKFLRDVLLELNHIQFNFWFFDEKILIQEYAQTFTFEQIISMIKLVNKQTKYIKLNTNPQYAWDCLQIGLMEAFYEKSNRSTV